jgi:hypothetical protein
LAGKPPMFLNNDLLIDEISKSEENNRRNANSNSSFTQRKRRNWIRNDLNDSSLLKYSSREHYTKNHLNALGSEKSVFNWQKSLPKVYDSENGTCCHQCRLF